MRGTNVAQEIAAKPALTHLFRVVNKRLSARSFREKSRKRIATASSDSKAHVIEGQLSVNESRERLHPCGFDLLVEHHRIVTARNHPRLRVGGKTLPPRGVLLIDERITRRCDDVERDSEGSHGLVPEVVRFEELEVAAHVRELFPDPRLEQRFRRAVEVFGVPYFDRGLEVGFTHLVGARPRSLIHREVWSWETTHKYAGGHLHASGAQAPQDLEEKPRPHGMPREEVRVLDERQKHRNQLFRERAEVRVRRL